MSIMSWFKKKSSFEVESPEATGHGVDSAPARSGLLSIFPGARRDAAIAELQKGYGEVRDLIRHVRDHMERQSERGDRLLDVMERLPSSLQALPETNRNQVRMLEVIQMHLDQEAKQAGRLHEAIQSMASAARAQSQVLGSMQQQMETSRDHDQMYIEGMNVMNTTLQRLNSSSDAGVETLRQLCESGRNSDHRMQEMVERNAKHMTILTITSGVLALLALGAMGYALYVILTRTS